VEEGTLTRNRAPDPGTGTRNRVWVLLPAYNEEENLPGLLRQLEELRREELRVVVVDDGSTDRTSEAAARWEGDLQVELVRHPRNLGLGRAVATGLRHVLERAHPRTSW
jgi:dolichol-phosphate mannosyltransferase